MLDSVVDLQEISGTLIWTPPFTLDLTGVDPDIIYCVEVYNITCGRRDLIISDCNVTEPSYTLNGTEAGDIYEYIVTPRSNVEGAKNGTPSRLNQSSTSGKVCTVHVETNSTDWHIIDTYGNENQSIGMNII